MSNNSEKLKPPAGARKPTISLTNHVVDDCISINANTRSATRLDHSLQLSPCPHARVKFVTDRLINKVPWSELVILLVVV